MTPQERVNRIRESLVKIEGLASLIAGNPNLTVMLRCLDEAAESFVAVAGLAQITNSLTDIDHDTTGC